MRLLPVSFEVGEDSSPKVEDDGEATVVAAATWYSVYDRRHLCYRI